MAKQTDYKFWYITRQDDIHISECAVRFYEGRVTTEVETELSIGTRSVTRYRRIRRLKKEDLPHFANKRFRKEKSGSDCVIFTNEDFGLISDDDELRVFLNRELAKDKDRIPNHIQRETNLIKLKKQKIR